MGCHCNVPVHVPFEKRAVLSQTVPRSLRYFLEELGLYVAKGWTCRRVVGLTAQGTVKFDPAFLV